MLKNKMITLENQRVRLEPFTQITDCKKVEHIALNEPNLLAYSPSNINTIAKLNTYFKIALKEKESGTTYPFLVFDKATNQYAGSTRFSNFSSENQRIKIGHTWIGKAFQGTGLNQQMKFLMLQFAFEQLNCERVGFIADKRNLKSRRAMEKIGATYEGCLRNHIIMTDGFRRDTVCYSILKEEFLVC